MDLVGLLAGFDGMIQEVTAKIGSEMEICATEGNTIVQERLVGTGRNAEGTSFDDYSNTRFAVSFFAKHGPIPLTGPLYDGPKVKGKRRKKVGLNAKYPDGITYKEYKTEVGRYTGKVDFQLTQDMLGSIGIIEQRTDGGRFVVRVGARDDHNRLKMIGNDAHRPGFYKLSVKEQERIAEGSAVRMGIFAEKFLAR